MKHLFFLIMAVSFLFVSCGTGDSAVKDDKPYKDTAAQAVSADEGAPSLEESAAKLDSKTVASIGAYVISDAKYKMMKKYNEEKYEYKLSAEQEKEFLEYVINKKLMAIEARKLGYAEKPEVGARYEWDFDEILSHAYYTDTVENKLKITDKEAKEYYDKNKEDFVELSAQHMLIKNKDLAMNLRKRIASGESYDDLTKKYSEDATTKDQGGKLPLFGKGVMVEEFEYAAFMLSPGEVSDPVKTIYGYHLIKVNEKKKISFDDSKDKIIQMVRNNKQRELFNALIAGLKKKYEVRVNENLLK